MNPRYPKTALRAGHLCEYCHAPEAVFNFPFEVEHIIPVSREGIDIESNWALACRSCNLRKLAHIDGIDPENQTVVRLFHPRKDRWEDHFQADAESGEIKGLTAVGRATVEQLNMNSEIQLLARRHWIHLDLFP